VAEGQILRDAISVGWSEERGFAERTAALGILGLEQMAPAGAPKQDLAGSSYLKTFGHRFPGFNAFGASHRCSFSFVKRGIRGRAHRGSGAQVFSS